MNKKELFELNEMDTIKVELRVKKIKDEWAVQWIENGGCDEEKTYYTDDRVDAIATKKAIIKSYSKTNFTNIVFIN